MPTVFDYVNTINNKVGVTPTDNLDEFNQVYVQNVVNLAFCRYPETIFIIDDLVCMGYGLSNHQHFEYLYNLIPKGNRFKKWNKPDEITELDSICKIYRVSENKARQISKVFSEDDFVKIKQRLYEGGRNKNE